MISEIFEYDNIIFDTSKSDGQIKKTVSNEKLMSLNPSFKFTLLKKGLLETIEWFKENYENIRK
jgi:GDP-L-fucose synthase